MSGFLGTSATLAADANLLIQLLMGAALLVGMMLARRQYYRAHAICQGSVMVLNLLMIGLIMLPPFWREVVPGLPGRLGNSYYFMPAVHAALGSMAQLLGLYIVLRAGTNLLPPTLCFQNYKLWMRTELVLWWIVIAFGVATYYVWL
ncbi:MAG: DUF420 domain-containing protein [Candidatus Binatia bacterium]